MTDNMIEPLLEIRDLGVAYGGRRVVDGFSLDLARGRCAGVIGESGAGKSQAFLAMMGLLDARATVSGTARLGGDDLLAVGTALRGRRAAMIFQDPLTSLTPHLRIGEQIAEPLRLHRGLDRAAATRRAAELLEQVQVNDVPRRLRQYPHELSGGMRQRVMIAIALACDPELIVADEPTTALDVSVQAQLLKLLRELVRDRGTSLAVITHDMGVVAALADDVVVMRSGRIVERGPVSQVLASPRSEYTRELLDATPRMDIEAPRVNASAERRLDVRELAVHHRLRPAGFARAPLTLRAVDGVSFDVRAGEALGIVGESGCGKSTLARALLRLAEPDAGRIVWMGREIQSLGGEELRRLRSGLQLVFQDPVASLDPTQSVLEIVAEPLRALRPELDGGARESRVRAMLDGVGLGSEYARRRARELSGGQCQRVAIARAMILEPSLLVCDEAVSSLDVSIQAQILALLANIKRERGTSLVFVSHNLAVVRQLCERVLVMYLGRVVEQGDTQTVFRQPRHPYTRLLLDSVPQVDPALERARLDALAPAGETPSAVDRPTGCAFHTRCRYAVATCATTHPIPETASSNHQVACLRWRDLTESATETI